MRPRFLLLILSFLSFPSVALAFDTPEELIAAIYKPYMTDSLPEGEEALRSQNLQALYDADAAQTPEGEMGALGFDPFVNGQDYQVTNLEIVDSQVDGDSAVVEVTFDNLGEQQNLLYSLVKEPDGWKIDDVQSLKEGAEYRLTDIFYEAQAN